MFKVSFFKKVHLRPFSDCLGAIFFSFYSSAFAESPLCNGFRWIFFWGGQFLFFFSLESKVWTVDDEHVPSGGQMSPDSDLFVFFLSSSFVSDSLCAIDRFIALVAFFAVVVVKPVVVFFLPTGQRGFRPHFDGRMLGKKSQFSIDRDFNVVFDVTSIILKVLRYFLKLYSINLFF